jgi:hypothetical protein
MKESIAMTEQSGFWPDGARLAVSVSIQFEADGQPVSGAGGPITEPILPGFPSVATGRSSAARTTCRPR